MKDIAEIALKVTDPMAIVSLCALIFFGTLKLIIKKEFIPQAEQSHAKEILLTIINKLFILSLAGMIMGFTGFVLSKITTSFERAQKIEKADDATNKLQTTVALSIDALQHLSNKIPGQRAQLSSLGEKLHAQSNSLRQILRDNTYYNIAPSPQASRYLNAAEETSTSIRFALSAQEISSAAPTQEPEKRPTTSVSYRPPESAPSVQDDSRPELPHKKPLPHTISIPVLIAMRLIHPTVENRITAILEGETLLQQVHTYYSNTPRARTIFNRHVPEIPINEEYPNPESNCIQKCIDSILLEKMSALRYGSSADKKSALEELTLIITILHEPLCCTIQSRERPHAFAIFRGRPTKFEAIWNVAMPIDIIGEHEVSDYAAQLLNNNRNSLPTESTINPQAWIADNHKQAVRIYRDLGNLNSRYYISKEYLELPRNREIINRQLLHSGVRLAYVLNTVLL